MLVDLGFGLFSLARGQDTNWDLTNYHRYNAFALLNGRMDVDLAPAGMQTYFNPLLDVPYYWMTQHGLAPVGGFCMGLWHGLVFPFLYLICEGVLAGLPHTARTARALGLAFAGCFAVSLVWGIGNCMGDVSTAVFMVGALAVIVRAWPAMEAGGGTLPLLASGIIAGATCGLKLTNAPFAMALCLAFFVAPIAWPQRLRCALAFAGAALAGLIMSWGWWGLILWQQFHDPLFPQFTRVFPTAWAQASAIVDANYLEHNFWEQLFLPFILPFAGDRVGEKSLLFQFQWAVVYLLLILWLIKSALAGRGTSGGAGSLSNSAGRRGSAVFTYVLAYLVIGFVLWMKVFSNYRFLAPLEVLLPLCIWVLFDDVLPRISAMRAARWAIVTTSVLATVGSLQSYGHADWTADAYRVEVPAISNPERVSVLITQQGGVAWLIPSFPPQVQFLSDSPGFAKGTAYEHEFANRLQRRDGDVFLLTSIADDFRVARAARIDGALQVFGLSKREWVCNGIRGVLERLRLAYRLEPADAGTGGLCHVRAENPPSADPGFENAFARQAAIKLGRWNLSVDLASCQTYPAFIGGAPMPYRWCRVPRNVVPASK
jgi:hypothetical protein